MIVSSKPLVSRFETFPRNLFVCFSKEKKNISLFSAQGCCTQLLEKSYRRLIFKQHQQSGSNSASEETACPSENQSSMCRANVKENHAQRSTLLMPAPGLQRQDDSGGLLASELLAGERSCFKRQDGQYLRSCACLKLPHVNVDMCNTHANVYYIHVWTHTQSKSKGGLQSSYTWPHELRIPYVS